MPCELKRDVPYGGFGETVLLRNEQVELVTATSFGPRVLRYARPRGANLFAEVSPDQQRVATGFGDDWHIYGGHRLWAAPEHAIHSYYPDNAAVEVSFEHDWLTLTQPVEPHTGCQKSIALRLHAEGSHVSVVHRIENRGSEMLELAPWALSALAPGGTAIFQHAPFRPHPEALAPAAPLVLWPFTRMNDARWSWGDRFFRLRQDPACREPQKVGLYNQSGCQGYALAGELFLKCHLPEPGPHADFGCNAQTFTNELFLELETLGPLTALAPGASTFHREEWFLFSDFALPEAERELAERWSKLKARAADTLSAHAGDAALVALLRAQ